MRVELLYFDGCANWKVADERLAEAVRALGRADVVVERRQVETAEQAKQANFIGSPSIRIDGTDPFATGEEQVGLTCRLYDTPIGPSGCPDTEQLIGVLS